MLKNLESNAERGTDPFMNKRKGTKNMWHKFGSPTKNSTSNLLNDPPASSTTKLLRGNRSNSESFYAATAQLFPAAAKTASAHSSTSAQTTQQIYGASNFIAGGSSPASKTLTGSNKLDNQQRPLITGHSAAALSFAAMEQMQIRNKWYSA